MSLGDFLAAENQVYCERLSTEWESDTSKQKALDDIGWVEGNAAGGKKDFLSEMAFTTYTQLFKAALEKRMGHPTSHRGVADDAFKLHQLLTKMPLAAWKKLAAEQLATWLHEPERLAEEERAETRARERATRARDLILVVVQMLEAARRSDRTILQAHVGEAADLLCVAVLVTNKLIRSFNTFDGREKDDAEVRCFVSNFQSGCGKCSEEAAPFFFGSDTSEPGRNNTLSVLSLLLAQTEPEGDSLQHELASVRGSEFQLLARTVELAAQWVEIWEPRFDLAALHNGLSEAFDQVIDGGGLSMRMIAAPKDRGFENELLGVTTALMLVEVRFVP
jgi:hypothetical protein